MRRYRFASLSVILLPLLAACATRSDAPPAAERFYDCTDVNGPIGVLHLGTDGQASVVEPDASKTEILGSYSEANGQLTIHNPDFGDMIYTETADRLVSVAPPNSSLAADQVACRRKAG